MKNRFGVVKGGYGRTNGLYNGNIFNNKSFCNEIDKLSIYRITQRTISSRQFLR